MQQNREPEHALRSDCRELDNLAGARLADHGNNALGDKVNEPDRGVRLLQHLLKGQLDRLEVGTDLFEIASVEFVEQPVFCGGLRHLENTMRPLYVGQHTNSAASTFSNRTAAALFRRTARRNYHRWVHGRRTGADRIVWFAALRAAVSGHRGATPRAHREQSR